MTTEALDQAEYDRVSAAVAEYNALSYDEDQVELVFKERLAELELMERQYVKDHGPLLRYTLTSAGAGTVQVQQ